MRKTSGLVLAGVVLMFGCKSDSKAEEKTGAGRDAAVAKGTTTGSAGSGATTTGSAGSGATVPGTKHGEFPLGEGESYFGGTMMQTNLVDWKVSDDTTVLLGIVSTGKDADGREQGVVRAYHVGGTAHDVGQKYSLDAKADHWAELKLLPSNRVLFRYGELGKGRRARNAVVLRWDADSKKVRVAKRWAGSHEEAEPAWLQTGEFSAAKEAETLCLKVIARIVSCEKDPKFRESIFSQEKGRPEMQEHFDTHVADWRDTDKAAAQCKRWASDDYVDTHFSEPEKLARLADETDMTCGYFGAEIVDEGGLPVASTDANP